MHHALYTYDIQHVIIDNLQFMTSGLGHGYERWEIQDDTLSLFRKFATEHQVHVTLVVHPRKEDRESLDMNSVFGSAKVTQEADNVVILQKGSNGLRYFDIKKNRFDGTLGVMSYKFDSKTQKVSL
jgi:twinkle protein